MKSSLPIEACTKSLLYWPHNLGEDDFFIFFFSTSNNTVAMATSQVIQFAYISCDW